TGHYTAFFNSLGGKLQMEAGASPNVKDSPNPNLPRHK
ncbi:hypothetical protein AAKU55_005944, partial [Oxalobacteraceae bacterium GrIS 1.11]